MGFFLVSNLDTLLDYVGFTQWTQRFVTMCVLFYIHFYNIPVHPETKRIPIIFPCIFFCGILILIVSMIYENIETGLFLNVFSVLVISILIYILIMAKNGLLIRIKFLRNFLIKINSKFYLILNLNIK